MDNTRYQELFRTGGITIVEDRSAVLERDKLQREVEGYKGRTTQFETVMEVVYKQVGIDRGYDVSVRAKVLLDRIIAYKASMAELEAELIKKDVELKSLRKQIAATAKSSLDDEVVGGGGG